MGKKSRRTRAEDRQTTPGEVGPRQPCPCGSGRRYKACHGNPDGAPPTWHARPFAGLAAECDLIALREFVPAATAPIRLRESDRQVLLCTLLPAAAPALVRADGTIWLGLQVQHAYGDPSRDLAAVLIKALDAEPGTMVGLAEDPGPGPRLQDLVVDEPLEVTVHEGFDYWAADAEDPESFEAVLEQANATIAPTSRIGTDGAAYWTSMGDREYLRWVRPEDEDVVLDAIARIHHSGDDRILDGARLLGMFRAYGLLVPVWDLPLGTGAAGVTAPLQALAQRLAGVLADPRRLDDGERATRAGLTSRQVTIR